MKNVVICDTALASSNVGDEIILDSICNGMSDVFEENFSLRLATHVNNFSAKQVAHSYVKQFLHKGTKIKYFQQADWKFVCGTNLIAQKRLFKINTQWKLYPSNLSIYKNCILIGVKADNCIISVSGYKPQTAPENDAKMIEIVRKNYRDVRVWIQTTEDEYYLDRLPGGSDLKRIYSLKRYRQALQEGNVDYVGTRLHGGVFAMQNFCRSLIISIDHRAEGFHKTNNLPILRREEIPDRLESLINSEFATEIILNSEAIAEFKSQFSGSENEGL